MQRNRTRACACFPLAPAILCSMAARQCTIRTPKRIWYNSEVEPEVLAMHQAHEFAHVLLQHAGRSSCKQEDLDAELPDDPVPLGHPIGWEGYSSKERRERDANVFARELLLPTTCSGPGSSKMG